MDIRLAFLRQMLEGFRVLHIVLGTCMIDMFACKEYTHVQLSWINITGVYINYVYFTEMISCLIKQIEFPYGPGWNAT